MIGGRDVIIPTTRSSDALSLAVRSLLNLWQQAVVEDAESGQSFRHHADINFSEFRELLVFRDPDCAKLWDELGSDPSLDGTLVHFLLSTGALTLAVDESPPPEIQRFISELRSLLLEPSISTTALRKQDLRIDGQIYATLLHDAEIAKQPYGADQKEVIVSTVDELLTEATTAARPGMLLGRVQSGKTKTFLGILALAMDNGFELFIVLTKGTKALSEQTYERLKQSFAHSIDDDLLRVYDIMAFPTKLTRSEQKNPIVIVAKKQTKNLSRLMTLLFETYPPLGQRRTLIIDDEADFASIGFSKKDDDGFADMQKIMSQIDTLRSRLQNPSFLQVTATPYSLYLQPRDAVNKNGELYQPIRPAFTKLVPIHGAYVGGEYYFGHNQDPAHLGSYIYVPVPPDELDILDEPDRRRFKIEEALVSPRISALRRSISTFIVGGVIRRLQAKRDGQRPGRYSFLVHTKAGRSTHQWQVQIVEMLIEQMTTAAEANGEVFQNLIRSAYDDLEASVRAGGLWSPSFEEVLESASSDVDRLQIEKVNSDNDVQSLLDINGQLELRNALNVFIGGGILDRGLTITNMIGFFYGRRANRLQQDTVLQHHRMYGARSKADMAVTRFYTTPALYQMLRTIHEFDAALRASIEADGGRTVAFIQKQGQQIVPCSPNKILASNVTTLRPGKRLLPVAFQTHYKTTAAPTLKKLDELVVSLVGNDKGPDPLLITVANGEKLLDLVNAMFDPDAGEFDFNVDAVKASIKYVSQKTPNGSHRDKLFLLVRRERENLRIRSSGRFFDSPDTSQLEGAIAKEVAIDVPMLMLFRQAGTEALGWRGSQFYWPVVYLPQNMRTVIFANDVNEFDEDEVIPASDAT
jgi:hypothetical protein